MKKVFTFFVLVSCVLFFSSCTAPSSSSISVVEESAISNSQQTDASEIVNPLKDIEYEELKVDSDEDFAMFLSEKVGEYSDLAKACGDYLSEHLDELENGKKLYEMEDFCDSFDAYYQWCYQIINYNSQKVPEEYRPAWKKLQGIAAYCKEMLDKIYTQDVETMNQTVQTMTEQVGKDFEALLELMPKPEISVGDTITEEGFAEIKLKKISYQTRINPSDTSGFYSYYEVKNKDNIYLVCQFDFTNLETDAGYDIGDYLSCSVTYDGGYTYTGWSTAEDSGTLTTYPNLLPLTTFNSYYVIEVPKKLQETPYTLTFTLNDTSYCMKSDS